MMNKRVSRSADLGCLGISLLILVVLLILLIPYLPNSLGALIPIAVIFSYYLIKVLISAAKRKIWDNRPLESADAYMERGTRKSMDNDPDAIHDFSKAIKLQPDYIIAYYYRGLAEQQFLDYKGALADFDLTLKMDPNNKWALGARGSVKNKLHDFYGAIADFSKAIEIDPKFGEIYYINRGIARSELHDYDGAITDFTKIIELDPERREAYFKRGIAKSELHDYDGAITDFTKTIELTIKLEPDIERNPRKAEVHDKARYSEFVESFFNRGILKDMLQDYKEAIIDFSKAIRYGKDYKEAYYYRGLVRKKINDFNG